MKIPIINIPLQKGHIIKYVLMAFVVSMHTLILLPRHWYIDNPTSFGGQITFYNGQNTCAGPIYAGKMGWKCPGYAGNCLDRIRFQDNDHGIDYSVYPAACYNKGYKMVASSANSIDIVPLSDKSFSLSMGSKYDGDAVVFVLRTTPTKQSERFFDLYHKGDQRDLSDVDYCFDTMESYALLKEEELYDFNQNDNTKIKGLRSNANYTIDEDGNIIRLETIQTKGK